MASSLLSLEPPVCVEAGDESVSTSGAKQDEHARILATILPAR